MSSVWEHTKLGAVCQRTQTIDPRRWPTKEFNYVDVSSVSNQNFAIEKTKRLLGQEAPSRARRELKSGDVIFATVRPTLMRIAQVPPELDDSVCSTGFIVLRPKQGLDARFLYYSLFRDEFLQRIESLQKGASYPAVNDGQVLEQPISYPSLDEQKRIVAVLDQAFGAIDDAKQKINAQLNDLQELRASVLRRAFVTKSE